METFGFIGLGNMGGPMAANIAGAGFELTIHDKAGGAGRAPPGAAVAGSAADVARRADAVFLCLPEPSASLAVAREIADTPQRRAGVIVDFSTTGVAVAKEIAVAVAASGVVYADAPVSGGRGGAVAGSLTVMWAGPAALLDALRPALGAVAANVFHVGDKPGQGQAMKLLNNFLSATAMAATAEAVIYGEAEGLDMATMLDVLNVSTGRNSATADKFPKRILTGSYDSGFHTALMAKDTRLYGDGVRRAGTPSAIGEAVVRRWQGADRAMPGSDFTRIYDYVRAAGKE